MTDICDEKPDFEEIVWEDAEIANEIRKVYDQEKMDAWLEKLKTSFDESIADCHHSIEIITKRANEYKEKAELFDKMPQMIRNTELTKKLESITNIVKEFEYPHPFLRGDHNDWLNRLRKILGIQR